MEENKYIIISYQLSPAPDIQAGFLDTINKRMVNNGGDLKLKSL